MRIQQRRKRNKILTNALIHINSTIMHDLTVSMVILTYVLDCAYLRSVQLYSTTENYIIIIFIHRVSILLLNQSMYCFSADR